MHAESREAVFAALRARGIKAIKVVAADGSKANGEARGIRKRVVAVLGALCFVLGAIVVGRGFQRSSGAQGSSALSYDFDSTVRRQIIGDAAVIEKGILTGWAEVFSEEGDRFLASFAIPGVPAGQRTTTEQALQEALAREGERGKRDEGLEARQIRAMVEGMKNEARQFLADGGTVAQYCRLLVQRQDEEIACHNRAKAEIEAANKSGMNRLELVSLWEKRNAALRQMGVKLVPLPE